MQKDSGKERVKTGLEVQWWNLYKNGLRFWIHHKWIILGFKMRLWFEIKNNNKWIFDQNRLSFE